MNIVCCEDDDEYLSEFHKQWNEACMKERERTFSMTFTAEYLRVQSQRMDALVRKEELMECLSGKRRKRLNAETIHELLSELDNEIARCEEILKRYREESEREISSKMQ